jgi:hypothetical protein
MRKKRLYNVDPILRFNEKYIVDSETGCWNWQAQIDYDGYGIFTIKGKAIRAHRFSYMHFNGPLVKELVCCHSCHNRACVNPNHLRLDSQKSNMIDMALAGNGRSQILSYQEAFDIKVALKNSYRGQINDLAHFYKVCRSTISEIKRGSKWAHISIP